MRSAIVLLFGTSLLLQPQNPRFDLIVGNGYVIDPRNGIDRTMDVAVAGGKVGAVAERLDRSQAARVVDATGLYVVPGLVDMHAHVFYGTERDAYLSNGESAVPPDSHSFRSCETTVVDAGGAGWRNFPQFKDQVIDRSKTRVLSFINIVGAGMKGGPVEQNLADMDARLTAMRVRQFPALIVGIKVAHYSGPEWDPVARAVAAGADVSVPVMIDFGGHTPPLPLEELLLKRLRPGDIMTHAYAEVRGRTAIVDENGRVRPYVWEARKRGVVFDVGHGGGSFVYRQAVPAMKEGFAPDVISTDLHTGSMNAGMKDILNVMSKFLNLGMSLQDVVRATTSRAAEVIRRPDLGSLAVGADADLAVVGMRRGSFGFVDVSGARMTGDRRLECELTLKGGQVMWDLNGIAVAGQAGRQP